MNKEGWKSIKINQLFDVILPKGDLKESDCTGNGIPLISAGSTNNGVVGYIDINSLQPSQIFRGNIITVDMFGKAYYQPSKFCAVSHGRVNILIPRFKMDKEIGLFVVSVIDYNSYRFCYGRAAYSNVIKDLSIFLPYKNDVLDTELIHKLFNDTLTSIQNELSQYIDINFRKSDA